MILAADFTKKLFSERRIFQLKFAEKENPSKELDVFYTMCAVRLMVNIFSASICKVY